MLLWHKKAFLSGWLIPHYLNTYFVDYIFIYLYVSWVCFSILLSSFLIILVTKTTAWSFKPNGHYIVERNVILLASLVKVVLIIASTYKSTKKNKKIRSWCQIVRIFESLLWFQLIANWYTKIPWEIFPPNISL